MPYKDADKQRLFGRNWKRATKQWFWDYKSKQQCNRCGFSNPAALQFHHPDEKSNTISRMVNSGVKPVNVLAELEKCECLCANCHAIEHNAQFIPTRAFQERTKYV